MEHQLKNIRFKQVDDAGTGVAVFATLNVIDSDGDVTLPGAFGEQLASVLPAHDWSHVPLGKARIYEAGDEALAEFGLNLQIEAARDWHAALKFDLAQGTPLQEWSYGYQPVEYSHGQHDGQQVRFLKRIKVFEVSPVVRGAGQGTRTLTMKGRGVTLADQIIGVRGEVESLVKRVQELKALRETEGRGLSAERLAEMAAIKSELETLAPLAADMGTLAARSDPAADDEARRLYSTFTFTRQRRR